MAMARSELRTSVAGALAVLSILTGCRTAAPPIRFAPPGTDPAKLRSEYPLSDAERELLTPESLRNLTQEQVDQIYARLSSGPIPDGPFRGDLFFPRDRSGNARVRELADPAPKLLPHVAALRVEQLGRALWKGKVFFRSQGILRNRIDDLAVLKLILEDSETIPKLTFDGETTWLLFPAQVTCSASVFDPARRAITIDYSKGPTIEGYRPVPDDLAGEQALNIRDEVRVIRRGLYLGRAYFGKRFGLNFTLLDPATAADTSPSPNIQEDCDGVPASDRDESLAPHGGPAQHGGDAGLRQQRLPAQGS
jgi:hypothetical protein